MVDAWAQPMEVSFIRHLPEVARLLQQSGSPITRLLESTDPSNLDSIDLGTDYLGALLEGHVNKVCWKYLFNEVLLLYVLYVDRISHLSDLNYFICLFMLTFRRF